MSGCNEGILLLVCTLLCILQSNPHCERLIGAFSLDRGADET